MIATTSAAPSRDAAFTSLGLSGRAQILVLLLCVVGAWFLLRLVRRRQMRGKYMLLWSVTGALVLVIAAFPGLLDRTARALRIYDSPNLLFAMASAFLLLVCVYFSYELSRLEDRTRVLAEELAILRAKEASSGVAEEVSGRDGAAVQPASVETGEAAGEPHGA